MRTASDPGARLVSAILAHAAAAGCPTHAIAVEQHDWSSATFVGLRQRIILPATANPAWLATLPEAAFTITGYLVADLAVLPAGTDVRHVVVETLLLCST